MLLTVPLVPLSLAARQNPLAAGGTYVVLSFLAAIAAGALPHSVRGAVSDVLVIGVAALPVGMGVAILKYRLYEIDRIVSRALAYAIVTGLLVAVYAGLVLLARPVLQAEDARVVLRSRCLHFAECGLRQGAIVRDSQVLVIPPGASGDLEYSIELVELDDEAGVWAGAFPGCPDAYGSAGEVIAALTSRPLDDPWVREMVAALDRDREWATWWGAGTGRLRQHLEIVRGRGKRVHATATENRESIDRHGLDWSRMGLAPGLAGNTRPELPAIFVCEDLDDVSFLLRIARVPTDIWSVDVDGIWLENAPNGWQLISHPVARERLTLLVRDIPAGGYSADQPEVSPRHRD